MRKLVPSLFVFLLCCAPAEASILYTFSGENNLSGTFTLDDTLPFVITETRMGWLYAAHGYPVNTIQGSFGEYTFTGTVMLITFHNYNSNDFCCLSSYWAIDSFLTGPEVNGRFPLGLSLYIVGTVDPASFPSLTPPPIPTNPDNFRYAFSTWPDGHVTLGHLNTLVLIPEPIPEPSSLLLIAVGLGAMVIPYRAIRRNLRALRAGNTRGS
jgi:PEP-CTERM motif